MGFRDWLKYNVLWEIESKVDDIVYGVRDVKYKAERAKDIVCELAEIFQEAGEEAREGIIESGKEFVELMGEGIDELTGKDKLNEAEEIYNKAVTKLQKKEEDFKKFKEEKENDLNNKIEIINQCKEHLYRDTLKQFINLASKIEETSIKSKMKLDYDVKIADIEKASMPSYYEILKRPSYPVITFISSPIVGIWKMRSAAKKTLENAKEVELQVELELKKITAERRRLTLLNKSMNNVCIYFEEMLEVTNKVIDKFEKTLKNIDKTQMYLYKRDGSNKLDLELLPDEVQDYFIASYNMCATMIKMGQKQYIENKKVKSKEVVELENKRKQFIEIYEGISA